MWSSLTSVHYAWLIFTDGSADARLLTNYLISVYCQNSYTWLQYKLICVCGHGYLHAYIHVLMYVCLAKICSTIKCQVEGEVCSSIRTISFFFFLFFLIVCFHILPIPASCKQPFPVWGQGDPPFRFVSGRAPFLCFPRQTAQTGALPQDSLCSAVQQSAAVTFPLRPRTAI